MSKAIHLEEVDFIKGLAAISVIFLHTLPRFVLIDTLAVFHIWQAVPMFLFISFYLGFRNFEKKEDVLNDYYSKERFQKVLLRIWLPLIVLAVLEAVFFLLLGNEDKAIGSLLCYANGPGSYYVWCYMQIWILMPVIYLLFKRLGIIFFGWYLVDSQRFI